ncbi:hypothetical protein ACTUVM_001786 [Azotobacter vinelandii]
MSPSLPVLLQLAAVLLAFTAQVIRRGMRIARLDIRLLQAAPAVAADLAMRLRQLPMRKLVVDLLPLHR